MKAKILPLLSFISFSIYFSGCKSTKQDTFFYDLSLLKNCILVTGEVKVTLNQIEDIEIENELKHIISVKTKSLLSNNKNTNQLKFNISVIERSLIENFETKYSSFIYSSITDENNTIIFENCNYKKSDQSIASSTYLNDCVSEIYSKLNDSLLSFTK